MTENEGTESASTTAGDDDLQAELERLRAENAALQQQVGESGQKPTGGQGWRRRWLSITCAVLAGIFLPLSVITVWARDTVLNTNDYVATVAPLADDEDIQESVTFRVTEVIAEEADFEGLAEEALPEDAAILAGPIASGAESLISQVVAEVVGSDQFATLWKEANRTAHEGIVALATGRESDAISTSDGRVVLKLGSLAEEAVANLDERLGTDLADKIPAEDLDAEVVLFESDELADVQDQVRWFDRLSWFTLILAIAFLVGTVLFAEDRRLGVRRVGLAVAIPMLGGLLAYAWGRDVYTNGLPDDVHNPAAATAIFDILTRFVLRAFRTLLVVGLLLLLGAWVTGPSPHAARVRDWWDALLGRAGERGADRDVGPVPIAVAEHERSFLLATAALGFLALVLWTHPTGMVVLLIVIVTLLVMGAIRLVAEGARRSQATHGSGDDDAGDTGAGDDDGEPEEPADGSGPDTAPPEPQLAAGTDQGDAVP